MFNQWRTIWIADTDTDTDTSTYAYYELFRARLGCQVSRKRIRMISESLHQQYIYKLVQLVKPSYSSRGHGAGLFWSARVYYL
jgi:hypothetical protein